MARSLNRAQLIGNLGQDPEIRSTPSGASVCNISVATTDSYKDRNGEWQEQTEWHRVVLWNRLADTAGQYLRKGNKVFIEGKIKTRAWDDRDGNKRYTTEIWGDRMIMMGGGGQDSSPYGQVQPQQQNNYNQQPQQQQQGGNSDYLAPDAFNDENDDVPF